MNKVSLIGRLTKDVEIRQNGEHLLAMFTIAVTRNYKNKETGAYEADFISCRAFGGTADLIAKYCGTKGRRIGVTGCIQTGSYVNKKGETIYTTDVIVDGFDFCDDVRSNNGSNNSNSYGNASSYGTNAPPAPPPTNYVQGVTQRGNPQANMALRQPVPPAQVQQFDDDYPF